MRWAKRNYMWQSGEGDQYFINMWHERGVAVYAGSDDENDEGDGNDGEDGFLPDGDNTGGDDGEVGGN